jgi:serine/threonine protein kinase
LRPGSLIDDRYRLDEPTVTGGAGQVWRATDETLGRTVAVKILRPRHLDDDSGTRFLAEARAMAALLHPGVAAVYDYGQTRPDGGPTVAYLVMAWVDGQSLADRIAQAGRLGAAETASIVSQAGRALQAVHDAGVVHRDVTPANLVVDPDGQVVLVDFGLALAATVPGLSSPDEVVDTAPYRAPEQATRGPISPATDVYALGAVAYHCLAGRPPYLDRNAVRVATRHQREAPPPLPHDVPAVLRDLVATAMAEDPAHRFPTAAAMAEAAEAAVDADERPMAFTLARGPYSPAVAVRRPRRSRRPRAAVATLIACVIATMLAALARADPAGPLGPPSRQPNSPEATSSPNVGQTIGPGGGSGGELTSTATVPGAGPGRPVGTGAPAPVSPGGAPRPSASGSGGGKPTPVPTTRPTSEPGGPPSPDETSPEPQPSPAASDPTDVNASPEPDRSPPPDDGAVGASPVAFEPSPFGRYR